MATRPCADCGENFTFILSGSTRCPVCFDAWKVRTIAEREQRIAEQDADDPCDTDFMREISS